MVCYLNVHYFRELLNSNQQASCGTLLAAANDDDDDDGDEKAVRCEHGNESTGSTQGGEFLD
jgi:hypothetical protein